MKFRTLLALSFLYIAVPVIAQAQTVDNNDAIGDGVAVGGAYVGGPRGNATRYYQGAIAPGNDQSSISVNVTGSNIDNAKKEYLEGFPQSKFHRALRRSVPLAYGHYRGYEGEGFPNISKGVPVFKHGPGVNLLKGEPGVIPKYTYDKSLGYVIGNSYDYGSLSSDAAHNIEGISEAGMTVGLEGLRGHINDHLTPLAVADAAVASLDPMIHASKNQTDSLGLLRSLQYPLAEINSNLRAIRDPERFEDEALAREINLGVCNQIVNNGAYNGTNGPEIWSTLINSSSNTMTARSTVQECFIPSNVCAKMYAGKLGKIAISESGVSEGLASGQGVAFGFCNCCANRGTVGLKPIGKHDDYCEVELRKYGLVAADMNMIRSLWGDIIFGTGKGGNLSENKPLESLVNKARARFGEVCSTTRTISTGAGKAKQYLRVPVLPELDFGMITDLLLYGDAGDRGRFCSLTQCLITGRKLEFGMLASLNTLVAAHIAGELETNVATRVTKCKLSDANCIEPALPENIKDLSPQQKMWADLFMADPNISGENIQSLVVALNDRPKDLEIATAEYAYMLALVANIKDYIYDVKLIEELMLRNANATTEQKSRVREMIMAYEQQIQAGLREIKFSSMPSLLSDQVSQMAARAMEAARSATGVSRQAPRLTSFGGAL